MVLAGRSCFSPLLALLPVFLQQFGKALLWVRAVPAVLGAALWLGRAGGPTAPRPPEPSQNLPGLKAQLFQQLPSPESSKSHHHQSGHRAQLIQSCCWCWEGLVPAVPSPLVLGTVWGQLMVSAWDRASRTAPEGLFLRWWLSCGHGLTQGSWGWQEPQGASPGPGVGAPGDSGVRAGPHSGGSALALPALRGHCEGVRACRRRWRRTPAWSSLAEGLLQPWASEGRLWRLGGAQGPLTHPG